MLNGSSEDFNRVAEAAGLKTRADMGGGIAKTLTDLILEVGERLKALEERVDDLSIELRPSVSRCFLVSEDAFVTGKYAAEVLSQKVPCGTPVNSYYEYSDGTHIVRWEVRKPGEENVSNYVGTITNTTCRAHKLAQEGFNSVWYAHNINHAPLIPSMPEDWTMDDYQRSLTVGVGISQEDPLNQRAYLVAHEEGIESAGFYSARQEGMEKEDIEKAHAEMWPKMKDRLKYGKAIKMPWEQSENRACRPIKDKGKPVVFGVDMADDPDLNLVLRQPAKEPANLDPSTGVGGTAVADIERALNVHNAIK